MATRDEQVHGGGAASAAARFTDRCISVIAGGEAFAVAIAEVLEIVGWGAGAGEAVVSRLGAELAPEGLLFVATSEVPRVRSVGLSAVRIGAVTAFRRRDA